MAITDLHRKINENGMIESWAKITVQQLIKNLDKYKIGVSQQLRESLKYTIVKDSQNFVDRVTFSFNLYGRFVDMGVGKGNGLGAAKESKRYREANGLKGVGPGHLRKKKPWESKGFTSQSFRLQELLAEMMQSMITTEVADSLSKIPFVINRI